MAQAKLAQKTSGKALIAVGSNEGSVWGNPEETVRRAIDKVAQALGNKQKVSGLYHTPAFPAGSSPDYINAAFVMENKIAPRDLLDVLHGVEADALRTRDRRWGQRTLDLDLIAMGDAVVPDTATVRHWMGLPIGRQRVEAPGELVLPHPRVQDRAFVLIPLAEVAPDWRHPILGLTVSEMLDALPQEDREAVTPV